MKRVCENSQSAIAKKRANKFNFEEPLPKPTHTLDAQNKLLDAQKPSRDTLLDSQCSQETVSSTQSHKKSAWRSCVEKAVVDPIHHVMQFPICVWRIIDTPEFQRLRQLKQLGASSLVYPSASHSRFEHSLGVGYLAIKLCRTLRQNQRDLRIDDKDILCVCIAGLCHDLGHGPFSHLFDAEFIDDGSNWSHERGSVQMLEHLLEENAIDLISISEQFTLNERDVEFIKELILGKYLPRGMEMRQGRGKEKAFLYEIVNNERNGFDVDKLDYLKRDAYHAGVSMSLFNIDYLFSMIRVMPDRDGIPTLCFPDHDHMVDMVKSVYQQRRELHKQIYQNDSVKAQELMIRDILRLSNPYLKFKSSSGVEITMKESIRDMSVFAQLKDSVLDLIEHSKMPELKPAQELIKRIKRRDLYKAITSKVECRTASSLAGRGNTISPGKISKSEKRKLEAQMVEKILAGAKKRGYDIVNEDFIVELMTINYGKGAENPLNSIYFFSKYGGNAVIIDERKYIFDLPNTFEAPYLRCFAKILEKNGDLSFIDKLRTCFLDEHKKAGNASPVHHGPSQITPPTPPLLYEEDEMENNLKDNSSAPRPEETERKSINRSHNISDELDYANPFGLN